MRNVVLMKAVSILYTETIGGSISSAGMSPLNWRQFFPYDLIVLVKQEYLCPDVRAQTFEFID